MVIRHPLDFTDAELADLLERSKDDTVVFHAREVQILLGMIHRLREALEKQ